MEIGTSPSTGTPDPPGLGRSLVIGSAIGAILCVVFVGSGMLAFGQSWSSALGFGLFAAFWGGVGFGSMLGGVFWAARAEAAAGADEEQGPV